MINLCLYHDFYGFIIFTAYIDGLFFTSGCNVNYMLIKIHNSLDSIRPHGRLLKNLKTLGFGELFLPENDFKT